MCLGVLGVSSFCGKKCYDFPNIQSKAETTVVFFLKEDEDPGPILQPILVVGLGCSLGVRDFDPWTFLGCKGCQVVDHPQGKTGVGHFKGNPFLGLTGLDHEVDTISWFFC